MFSDYEGKTINGKKKVDCWSDKNELQPNEISYGSAKKFWFNCDNCPHDFECNPNNITHNKWCPYCCHNPKLCGSRDCTYCLKKSFASYNGLTKNGKNKIDCWSDKNKLETNKVLLKSNKEFLFNCDCCLHDFKCRISEYTTNNDKCPYCYNRKRCGNYDCNICFKHSFASFEGLTKNGKKKVDCWCDKNELKPINVAISENIKYWFDCDNCNHNFKLSPNNIRNWCPYCNNKKRCGNYDCNICFKHSFASFEGLTKNGKKKIDCWSDKKCKPIEVSRNSKTKFTFKCDTCNKEFKSDTHHILQGTWCPRCNDSKLELKISEVIKYLEYKTNSEIWFKDCRDILPLPFDNGIINELPINILIEGDGIQHFSLKKYKSKVYDIKSWLKRVKHDIYKNGHIVSHNMILVRISYNCIEQTEELIKQSINMSKNGESGIIYSDPELYKNTYMKYFKFLRL